MIKQVTLKIDNMTVRTFKGASVLDAALASGICIPHLCYVPVLKDSGACRLCIVEHIVKGRGRVTASCTLLAEEGMVIRSDTEKIKKLRRNIAELLVAQAPNSRAIQDIAMRCGVTEVRYPFRNDDCVQCGRCVRYCTEYTHAHALGFIGRGPGRHVDFALGFQRDLCKNCGFCTEYCPMTITPCGGSMKQGEEHLCGNCQGQQETMSYLPGACVRCDLGKGFNCARHAYA